MRDSQWGNMQRLFCPFLISEKWVNILHFILKEVNQMSPGYISPYFVSFMSISRKLRTEEKWLKTEVDLHPPSFFFFSFFQQHNTIIYSW